MPVLLLSTRGRLRTIARFVATSRSAAKLALLTAVVSCLACSDGSSGGAGPSTTWDAAMMNAGVARPSHDAAAAPASGSAATDSPAPAAIDAGANDAKAPGSPPVDAASPGVGAPPDATIQADAAQAGSPFAGPTSCAGRALPPRALGKSPPFATGPEAAGLPAYWPTSGWRKEDPAKLGFDAAALAAAVAFSLPNTDTQAVLVIRHGYVAAEVYRGTFTATTRHESYSMAKSFTSALIGIAQAEGKLSINDRICNAYPTRWDCAASNDPRSRITVEHAMNLATGLEWQEDWRSTATTPNDALTLTMLDDALARRSVAEPGTTKRYSTGDPALLAGVLQKATGMTHVQYAKQKLFDPIGISGVMWNTEVLGGPASYAFLQATASEYAKFGYLYLQRGRWDGKQVVPSEWVDLTTQSKNPCEDWYQFLWHVNPPARFGKQDPNCASLFCPPASFADLPRDAFFAEGVAGQYIFVVPSADLVVVRLGDDGGGVEHWDEFGRGLLEAVIKAIR